MLRDIWMILWAACIIITYGIVMWLDKIQPILSAL